MPGCNHCEHDVTHTTLSPTYRRVLWAALIINAAMFFVEVLAGVSAGSVSLMADALDFFGDAANYGVSLFVLGMAVTARAKASLLKGFSMAAFGVGVLAFTVHNYLTGEVPEPITMGAVAVLALIANVAVALMLYRWREGDSNMRSVWLCSRNDAIGNIAVALAAIFVGATGTYWPDLIVATLMAVLALTASKSVIAQALLELRQVETSKTSSNAENAH